MNILIAEDDEISWLYLKELLSGPGFSLKRACNGQEAVMITREDPEIDLILMDIKMPVLNGYDAVQEIRKFNKNIPIIAQTAYALAGDREKAINAGCNDHISKPIIKDELLGHLSRYIK
jgi:two-component system, cell cycle response regulator DivK